MVSALILQIVITIVDRFIYKSWCVIDEKQSEVEILKKEIVHKAIVNEQEYTEDQALIGNKLNTQVLITKQQIKFTSVSKFYFQWVTLIVCHAMLFHNLPHSSDKQLQSQMMLYMYIFYLLSCLYFLVSALQVRHGQPE